MTQRISLSPDKVCFLCEIKDAPRTAYQDQYLCPKCPALPLQKGPRLLEHFGGHILFDSEFQDERKSPCGLCLSTTGSCKFRLKKSSSGTTVIDMDTSQCKNLYKIALGHAGKSTPSSPCTNIPVLCPYCPIPSDAIWRYNFLSHIRTVHSNILARLDLSKHHISDDERTQMHTQYLKKPRHSHSQKSKNAEVKAFTVSENHTSAISDLQ